MGTRTSFHPIACNSRTATLATYVNFHIYQSPVANPNCPKFDVGKYNIKLTLSAAQTIDCSLVYYTVTTDD